MAIPRISPYPLPRWNSVALPVSAALAALDKAASESVAESWASAAQWHRPVMGG